MPQKGKTLRTLIEEMLKDSEFRQIRQRVTMDDASFREVLSGCHLAKMISELLETMAQRSGFTSPQPASPSGKRA